MSISLPSQKFISSLPVKKGFPFNEFWIYSQILLDISGQTQWTPVGKARAEGRLQILQ
jgi:hypothetical protein